MQVDNNFVVTQWLSLADVLGLLEKGEVSVMSEKGTVRLFLNFIDRVAAQELAKKINLKGKNQS